MKKNFLKFLLLGVFTLSLGAGFVGCKDYDDDIDDLRDQIEKIKSELSGISGFVKDLSYNESTGVLTVTMNDNTTKTVNLKQDMVTYNVSTSINGDQLTITLTGSDGTNSSSTVTIPTTDVPDPTDMFDASKLTVKDGVVYYGDDATGVSIPSEYAGDSYIVALTDTDGAFIGYKVVYEGAEYPFYLGGTLASLVLVPDAYLGGVQANKSGSLEYEAWTRVKAASTDAYGEIFAPTVALHTTTPVMVAKYHLNPSSVDKDQVKSIQILSEDKLYLSRAADSNPVYAENFWIEDGYLYVEIDLTSENVRPIDDDEEITVFAVQVVIDADEEITITSDYAAIYRSIMYDFTLSLKDKPETGHNGPLQRHVYGADAKTYTATTPLNDGSNSGLGHAEVAIQLIADYELPVSLVGQPLRTLDLKDKITTHYKERLNYENTPSYVPSQTEQAMDDISKYGLEYRFHASGYLQGGNNTDQKNFLVIDEKTGVVHSTVYNDPTTGQAAVGRQPLVRVDLVDTKNNDAIVNSGWIKIIIVDDPVEGGKTGKDFGKFVVNCTDDTFHFSVADMNNLVYDFFGMDDVVFHSLYTIDGTSLGGNRTQAVNPGNIYDGTVIETSDLSNGRTTYVLDWTITPAQAEYALANNDGKLSFTVVYKANNVGYGDIEILLEAEVQDVTAEMSQKLTENWNSALTTVYVNVEIPGTSGDANNFHGNLNNSFIGGVVKFALDPANAATTIPADYNWANGNMDYRYQFQTGYTATESGSEKADGSKVTYTVSVDNSFVGHPDNTRNPAYATAPGQSYSYLLAHTGGVTELVAFIDTYTGAIEYNNGEGTMVPYTHSRTTGRAIPSAPVTLNYQGVTPIANNASNFPSNSFATDLLNRDYATGTNMFGADVEVVLNNSCRDITVTNGDFTVQFYRPVNVTSVDTVNFSDNENNGTDIPYTSLVQLTDWRLYYNNQWNNDKHFWNTQTNVTGQPTYWGYYMVESIMVDISNITTNMSGGDLESTKLSQRNPGAEVVNNAITHTTWPTVVAPNVEQVDYGYVHYENNGVKLQTAYQLRLPIVVTYRWGTITEYVVVTVNP